MPPSGFLPRLHEKSCGGSHASESADGEEASCVEPCSSEDEMSMVAMGRFRPDSVVMPPRSLIVTSCTIYPLG